MAALGWDAVDVVFVSGDAYVDHPSFAMAILKRTLEAAGYRVAMLSQPDWRNLASTVGLLMQFAEAPLRSILEARIAIEPGMLDRATPR